MISHPSGAPERTQQLLDQLHRLHALGSSPSIRTLAGECGLGVGTVHRLFTEPVLPRPAPMLRIVEALAKKSYKIDPSNDEL